MFCNNEELFALLEHYTRSELLVNLKQVVLLCELATVILPKVLKKVLAHVLQKLFSRSILGQDVLCTLIQHCTGTISVFPEFFNEFP